MKKMTLIFALVLSIALLAGCAGTPVIYYTNCTCPTGGAGNHDPANPPAAEGDLKIGLAIDTDLSGSKSGEKADFSVTIVAVAVDQNGVIQDCIIDGIATKAVIGEKGNFADGLVSPVQTKNELGESYGMVAWGGAIAEWNVQAEAFANYVIGKTVEQVKGIAVSEATKPTDADLAASVTIAIGGFQTLIEKAVGSAQALGSQAGDTLKLGITASLSGTQMGSGIVTDTAKLDVDVAVLTMKDETITGCYIDAVQAAVVFANGELTTVVSQPVKTKNELGDQYGMVNYGNAMAEWNVQVASFCEYVTGKTVAQVKGIAVNESTKPTDADLSASVTIAIGGFQALIEKAAQ